MVEGEGMPFEGTEMKGNLYVTLKVNIPEFTDS